MPGAAGGERAGCEGCFAALDAETVKKQQRPLPPFSSGRWCYERYSIVAGQLGLLGLGLPLLLRHLLHRLHISSSLQNIKVQC